MDRNLCFAVVAFEEKLLDEVRFVDACRLRTQDPQSELGDLLVQRGWLTPIERARVEHIVARRLVAVTAEVEIEVRRGLAALGDWESGVSNQTSTNGMDSEDNPSLPPATFPRHAQAMHAGRTVLLDEIARGGMGIVLRGHDPSLGRELAVKVLGEECQGYPDLVRRFLEEAQVAGQLEHPGVPPVHDVGWLPDGRPYFTMRLVRGQTLSALLASRTSPQADLPRYLAIFEQIAQTLAHAHSRGVIHRDLKPGNVMVGAFGEVQVMDWGLAKVLQRSPEAEPTATVRSAETTPPVRLGEGSDRSRAGMILGTPGFMAPEQARGEIENIDERADVFGLGAILCVILTGRPPYARGDRGDIQRQAAAGEIQEALTELDRCAADQELIQLCRECLAPRAEDRPGNAGDVVRRVAAYQEGVREQLRRAERDRAAAEARAFEERKRRRVALGLALAVVLLVTSLALGGAYLWQEQANQQRDVASLIRTANALRGQSRWEAARAVLKDAEERATGFGLRDLRPQTAEAQRDLELARRLDDIRVHVNAITLSTGRKDSRPTDLHYGKLLAEAGIAQEGEEAQAVAERVQTSGIRMELITALDDWAASTVDVSRLAWLLDVGRRVDSSELRNSFYSLDAWQNRETLEKFAQEMEGARLPPSLVVALGRALGRRGGDPIPLLQGAHQAHPEDFWLNFDLAYHWREKQPQEALGYVRAALAARPDNEVALSSLGVLLHQLDRKPEAHQAFRVSVEQAPRSAHALSNYGFALLQKGDREQALGLWRRALTLDPEHLFSLGNLSAVLAEDPAQADEALALARRGLELSPDHPTLYFTLGNAYKTKGMSAEAATAYQTAILRRVDVAPNLAWRLHNNLGQVEQELGHLERALEAYRKAAELGGREWMPHANLGNIYALLNKPTEAAAAYDQALLRDPDNPQVCLMYGNLFRANKRPSEALVRFRQGLTRHPQDVRLLCNLGLALLDAQKVDEALSFLEKAVQLAPKDAIIHQALASAWMKKEQFDKAAEAYQRVLDLTPNQANVYYNLGKALALQGKLEEGLAATRRALAIQPQDSMSHNSVGHILNLMGDTEGALAALRKAMECDPRNELAQGNLVSVLMQSRRFVEAEAFFRDLLKQNPREPKLLWSLLDCLKRQGKFREASKEVASILATLPIEASERAVFSGFAKECDRLYALDERFPGILAGKDLLKDAEDRWAIVELCQYKQRHHAAARFADEVFRFQPERLADPMVGLRYTAVCEALLAAVGKGEDAKHLEATERARLRGLALGWLRADLELLQQLASRGPGEAGMVRGLLTHWRKDPDLAPVRGNSAIAALPESERPSWNTLWQAVAELLKPTKPTP